VGLVDELQRARWFGGKSRAIRETRVVDRARWTDGSDLRLVEVHYEDGLSETYVLADGIEDPSVARAVLRQFQGATIPTDAGGSLVFEPGRVLAEVTGDMTEPVARLRGEQSNTSVRFGDALILKLFRRLQFGQHPDVEVGRFLTEHSHFSGAPAVAGSLEYVSPSGEIGSIALLQRFVPNRGDAWTTMLGRLDAVLDGADIEPAVEPIARLGQTTAEMHVALASGSGDFSADPIQAGDVDAWQQAIADEVLAATAALAQRQIAVDTPGLLRRAGGILALAGGLKARHHGDYHLGQVLERQDGGFVIIDFEGEPSKPLAQRREKHSPLRDVAGMLRSLDYARHAALRSRGSVDRTQTDRVADWHVRAREAFLSQHLQTVRRTMPALAPAEAGAALAALELQKAAYEVLYELNNRPDWLPIPLAAIRASDTL
jgi:maltose alpha-D-glucosyltransferase / alpha-amylase